MDHVSDDTPHSPASPDDATPAAPKNAGRDDDGLYQRVLRQRGEATLPRPKPPRPSASVVLWRRPDPGGAPRRLEVYWVQRAETMPFMGGWHAFPGGGLSSKDARVPVEGTPRGMEDATDLSRIPESLRVPGVEPQPDRVPGLVACALRELFEETGILLVRELMPGRADGPVATAAHLEDARRRLLERQVRFEELMAELGVTPVAGPLVFAGRWMTPPFAPLRFDNRFFLLEWPRQATLQPTLAGGELAAGEWVEPGEAWRRWAAGEVIAAPPILHLLRVLAQDGPEEGLARLRDTREADLGPFRKIEFRPRVLMLPLATATLPPATHTNSYLVGGAEVALVDPGSSDPQELERLERALDDLQENHGQRVRRIWLTHHHPDHVGGVERLRRHLGVPVEAHPETARRLAARGIPVDGELTDGQVITFPLRPGDPAGEEEVTVRVIHTPGHAPGHLCFFEEGGRSLLAGDLVAGIGTIVVDPPEGDMDAYLASLDKARALEPATLFPAHGPAIRDGAAHLAYYRRHRLEREEKILAAWRDGLRDPQQMLPRVYDDAPQAAWPLAERQIEAHLHRLRRAGRLG